MTTTIVVPVAICAVAISSSVLEWMKATNSRSLRPPGPAGVPIIGNTLQIDSDKPYLTFSEWRSQYGDIIYCRIWGQDTIIVSSERIARDLLDKRSSNYSDKTLIVESKAYNLDWNTGWIPYSDTWWLHRRIYHQALRQEVVPTYRPMQLRQAHKLLEDLLDRPDAFEEHLQGHAAAIIMSVIYGYETKSHDDPMVTMIEKANDFIIPFGTPSAMGLIRAFPFLLNIPAWLPGGRVNHAVVTGKKRMVDMLEIPYRYVVQSLSAGTASASMIGDMLQRSDEKDVREKYEECLKNTAGTAFQAGADTTFTVLQNFVYAMVTIPEVQKRAQAQIDFVVGTERLPDFDDYSSLPLVEAILRETIRSSPVVPINLPHGVTNDDVYEGYLIPKGANVLVNTWEIHHDATRFPEPLIFKPERYLNADGSLTDDISHMMVFGYGRRMCPGRHLAVASVWSAIACMLATFRFEKAEDAQGKELEVNPRWTLGLTSRPTDFPCRIKPRFADTEARIARVLA